METNVISEVVELLGLELEQEFQLEEFEGDKFKITKDGFYYWDADFNDGAGAWGDACEIDLDLADLCVGRFTIVRPTFEPTYGKMYYHPKANDWTKVMQEVWCNTPSDFAYKAAGMAFETESECVYALRTLKDKFITSTEN